MKSFNLQSFLLTLFVLNNVGFSLIALTSAITHMAEGRVTGTPGGLRLPQCKKHNWKNGINENLKRMVGENVGVLSL